jgi:hypothetical protein
MKWVALVTWVLTAGGGFAMLGLWLKNGGMRQGGEPGDRIRPARILSHFALAAIGLVLWIVYVAADKDALAWVAFALLAVVALLGFSMRFIWMRQCSQTNLGAGGAQGGAVPAERHFRTSSLALTACSQPPRSSSSSSSRSVWGISE